MAFKPKVKQTGKAAPKRVTVAQRKALEEQKKLQLEKEVLEQEIHYRKGTVSLRDIISPSSFEAQSSYIRIGSKFARTLFVLGYPRYIFVGWFAPIINYSASFDISIFLHPMPVQAVLKQLRDKVGRVEAEISMAQEHGKPRDPAAETALKDMEKLRDDLTQGTEHFFSLGLYVTLYSDSVEKLDKLTEDIEAIFGTKLVYTKRVFYQAEQGFNSTLPLGLDELEIGFNMNTSPAAASFPFISSDLTSEKGILYGINRHNNSLILFDRFSLQNANSVVFATSGAGKSTNRNTPVLIKDSDGITMVKIGEYIDTLSEQYCFEPVDEDMEGVLFPGVQVYTFNKDLKGEWSDVSVAARKVAPEEEYLFHLASGREITVTGDHNMLVLRDGNVIATKSEEVKEGESIPLPTFLPEPQQTEQMIDCFTLLKDTASIVVENDRLVSKKKPHTYGLPFRIAISRELMRIFGYIVSEGTIGDRFVIISQEDKEVVKDIHTCLQRVGIPYFNRRTGDRAFVISSRVWVELIRALGLRGKSHEKRIPGIVYSTSNGMASEFLKAYFEGDGGLEQHAISASTKSKELASDLSYLLLRFGIVARLGKRRKRATNSKAQGTYHLITISGQTFILKFAEQIGFVSKRKKSTLAALLGKKANTNVWTIPVQSVFQELYHLFSFQLHGLQDSIELKNGSYRPSREKLLDVITKVRERIIHFENFETIVQCLAQLPCVETIVTVGREQPYNAALWTELGNSWQTMRSGIQPRARNVFRAANVLWSAGYDLAEMKSMVKQGFQELGLSLTGMSRSLQNALWQRDSDMDYNCLYRGAREIVATYYRYHNRLDRIKECVGILDRLASADLVWDPVVKIEKKECTDRYVYDLTVDNEVFLAGHGGLFVHNSYAIKLEVLRTMMMGADVIVIDPEKEYQHLCEAVGGTYINISLASTSRINPFDLPRPVGEQVSTADVIRSAVITLKGLMRLMLGNLNPEEDSIVDRALIESYAKKDITAQTDLTTVQAPTLQDLQDVLEGMVGTGTLVERLKKYTEGTFSGLLNHPTNVEMRNQLVVFSVRDLEDELRPMAIYTIVNYIWNVVRSQVKRRILVIDEAWWLMQHEDSARFVFALAKRCRKYYLGLTTITQDVNDFLNSQYGKAILTNSSLQLLLKQSPAAIDLVQKTFMLTEGEKYLLLESAPGEGIFFAGQKHVAIKIVASYSEDQLITTDPRQLLEIEAAKKEFAAEQEKQ